MNEMVPPESCRGLWYNPKVNRFKDDSGAILDDLTAYFPTWQLDIWKKDKQYALLRDRRGELWEVFYERITYYCDGLNCMSCATKCEVYHLVRNEYDAF